MMGMVYIGTALEYPLACDTGAAALIGSNDVIEASMLQILSTNIGELPFNPYFGSSLERLIAEPSDDIAKSLGRTYIVEALRKWEQRIDVLEVTAEIDATARGVVNFAIEYRVRARNDVNTFVFPFYRQLEY